MNQMSHKNLVSIILSALTVLSILSCKKNKDESLPSLEGSLRIIGAETFISADSEATRTIRLKPQGGSHPKDAGVGYYWRVSPLMDSYDTTRYENGLDKNGQPSDGSFEYTIKDTLGTFTIYCYAYAKGYTGLSASTYTTTVRPGYQTDPDGPKTTLSNIDITAKGTNLTGTDYYYISVGTQDWIANNISDESKGASFRGYDVMSDIFGRYYTYDEAKAVCEALPANGGNNWRLPSDEDWVNLVKGITTDAQGEFTAKTHEDIFWDIKENGRPSLTSRMLADASFNGSKICEYWPQIGTIDNTSGLSIIPVGYSNMGITPDLKSKSAYPNALFEGVYEFAAFWTADEVEDNTDMAYYRYIFHKDPHFMITKGYKETFGASVRCVRESL